ncbi:MAG TPA: adenylate/guanylate cyclase domain-containing protein [Actinomycetota bacterium]|nr:adenylate/guanylate cyclase domain-containing protein [Actinomycetota bacterium]
MPDADALVSQPDLAHWADLIARVRWAAFLLDQELRLVWASPDLQRFLGSPREEELGYGLHVSEAFMNDAWRNLATSESAAELLSDLEPLLNGDDRPIATSFEHVEPGGDRDLPVSRVNVLVIPLRGEDGAVTGILGLGFMSVRPGLVSLLARGDESMYERMAKLVEPSSHEAAILFCDLQGSTELARSLPTGKYFRLIRSLWTAIDGIVAGNRGIVGKHAGDGASAFFLVDDHESLSAAASAAIRTAREIHERSDEVFGDVIDTSCLMRVGVHWGSSLYIGQLVPGGRLDVTALGDAVNECARIQDCADAHSTLVTKDLIERLSDDDAARLGIDADKVRYDLVSTLPGADEKAIATAGAVAVTPL